MNCIFCKIVKGEVNAEKIYEDSKTLAFLDISPAQSKGGHVLVMPKNHYELITEMSDEDAKAVALAIKKISKALLKFGKGMNIIQNNRKIAGQFVPHVHFHLIPRFENDSLMIGKWSMNKYSPGQMEKIAEKIKSLL